MNRMGRYGKAAGQGLAFVLLALTLVVLTQGIVRSEENEEAPLDTQTQVYELRIYHAAPGKLERLNERFRDHTLRLFEKHGITNVGYWVSEQEDGQARLYYLIAYPDIESREKMLVNGIAADPEFQSVVVESEKYGALTTEIESVMLRPTDYSPLK